MVTLSFSGLSKSFGFRVVFENISATALHGSALVVTGPNGSGKTTLLRIIAGLLRPSAGRITLALDSGEIPKEELRRHLALVAPDLQLYDELTALENLAFLTRLRGFKHPQAHLEMALQEVGLAERGGDLVKAYSSGMKQRLQYAYARLLEPTLLLLDEPTANLDDAGKQMAHAFIQRQKERGIVVIATNEKEETRYGDQVIRLGR